MRGRLLLICVALAACASSASGEIYLGYERWGGIWSDAEKSPANTQDDLMCWAAATANILDWTGWGQAGGQGSADEIFAYFQDHWTDAGGMMQYGWQWWFNGANPSQEWTNWSHVDVPGGAFAPTGLDFSDFYRGTAADAQAMSAIDEYLREGMGVALILSKPGRSHAVTCWGFEYDEVGYLGIWITDSDDDRGMTEPPDSLRHFAVRQDQGRWHLQGYSDTDAWYVTEVQALGRNPDALFAPIPEPAMLTLFGLSGLMLCRRRR